MILRMLNRWLSPGGPRGRLAIMIFHRVLTAPDPLLPSEPDAGRFERDMRNVRRWFRVLPLAEAVRRLADGTLPARALALTFDDGYADNHDVALPILERLGLPATFFVATGYLDGGCMWNDRVIQAFRQCRSDALDLRDVGLGVLDVSSAAARRAGVGMVLGRLKYERTAPREALADRVLTAAGAEPPRKLMMTGDQVRHLAARGMSLGAHTHTHPILARLDASAARDEIARSRDVLQDLVQAPVRLFAYPNGKPGLDYGAEHVAQVKALGFAAACSTAPGVAAPDADLFQLPRFTPWDRNPWKFGVRMSEQLRHFRYQTA